MNDSRGGGIYPGALCYIVAPHKYAGRVCTALALIPNAHSFVSGVPHPRVWQIDVPGVPAPKHGCMLGCRESHLRPLQPPPDTRIVDIVRPERVSA